MLDIKTMSLNATSKIKGFYEANKYKAMSKAIAFGTTASAFIVSAGAEGEAVDIGNSLVSSMSSVDYNIVLTTVVALVPVIFPAVFNLMAVRKGISFVLGLFRGA